MKKLIVLLLFPFIFGCADLFKPFPNYREEKAETITQVIRGKKEITAREYNIIIADYHQHLGGSDQLLVDALEKKGVSISEFNDFIVGNKLIIKASK